MTGPPPGSLTRSGASRTCVPKRSSGTRGELLSFGLDELPPVLRRPRRLEAVGAAQHPDGPQVRAPAQPPRLLQPLLLTVAELRLQRRLDVALHLLVERPLVD